MIKPSSTTMQEVNHYVEWTFADNLCWGGGGVNRIDMLVSVTVLPSTDILSLTAADCFARFEKIACFGCFALLVCAPSLMRIRGSVLRPHCLIFSAHWTVHSSLNSTSNYLLSEPVTVSYLSITLKPGNFLTVYVFQKMHLTVALGAVTISRQSLIAITAQYWTRQDNCIPVHMGRCRVYADTGRDLRVDLRVQRSIFILLCNNKFY